MNPGIGTVRAWVDALAEVFAWVAIGFLIAQAGSWAGKDNFFVAIALGAAAAALFPNFVKPVKDFIKGIFTAVLDAIVDLIEFLGQWLAAVIEHFQGNLLRAIVRIVTVAAFLWIWNLARGIPVIGQLIDLIAETAGKLTAWVNQQVDGLLAALDRLRADVRTQIDAVLAGLGDLGRALREDVLREVDALFGGVRRELAQLRFELLDRVDLVRAALRAEITVLGERIRLVPEEARLYLRDRFAAGAAQVLADQATELSRAGPLPALPVEAAGGAWDVIEAAIAELPLREGVPATPAAAAVDGALAEVVVVLAGGRPALADWPEDIAASA